MKKIIATILTLGALHAAQAQQTQSAPPPAGVQPTKPSPEQVASRNSTHLQKALGLNDDQKQKVYQAILTRTTSVQAIHAKYGATPDKKAMHAEAKPVREQFVQTMDGILTPEQKTKWDEQRMKVKEHRMKNRGANQGPPSPLGGNGSPQKLTGDDDGIED
jgi:periplasmic protein CpxP/Spy